MSKFDWKATLATVAPAIATALGGPLAGVAVATASKALGLPDNSEDALASAVASGDPGVLVELKKAEQEFKTELKRLDVDLERIHAQDRGSARDLAKAQGILPQAVLSCIFVSAFAILLSFMFSSDTSIADDMKEPAMYLLGILSAGMTQVMNFWFGSSAGSKAKVSPPLQK